MIERAHVMIDLPPLTYLSVDSLREGVGASQVLPYVEALSWLGMTVRLHSLEKGRPSPAIGDRLDAAGVTWHPHPWGQGGPTAGLARLVRGATYLRGAELVHARSDLPAGSALLARRPTWIWDMRGFWADERIELGLLRPRSPEERFMRWIERQAARKAGAIVTLTGAAIDELERRHGPSIRDKSGVITTCVELSRFPVSPMPPAEPLNLVLAGTLSRRYDVPLMLQLLDELRRRRATRLTVLIPEPSSWDRTLRDAEAHMERAAAVDMPGHLRASHVGLSVLRPGYGVALKGSMPTKIGEFLASGRPVVVNAGLGDLDHLITEYDCGVILPDDTPEGLRAAADSIERLVADQEAPARCRKLAQDNFRLDTAIGHLVEIYKLAVNSL